MPGCLSELPAGSTAALSDPTAVRPSLSIDVAGDYQAQLTVSDGTATSVVDSVTLSSEAVTAWPRVERDLRADTGSALRTRAGVFLPAPDAPSEGQLGWCLIARPAGSTAVLSGTGDPRADLTPDLSGRYVVQLKLRGGQGGAGDEVLVHTRSIDTANLPARADAGPDRSATLGETVTLDAAGSTDLDGDKITYRWSLVSVPAGSTASLDDATALRPSFTVDLAGDYVVQLIADDGSGELSRPDTLVISTLNTRPIADAGPDQTVAAGATVALDGSGSSDPDGDPLSHAWILLAAPAGGNSQLSDATAVAPSFTAAAGDTLVQLAVSDGSLTSAPDAVLISTTNSRPQADAGADQVVPRQAPVSLTGSGSSDPDGDSLSYAWAIIHAPAGSLASLDDASLANPSLTPDLPGYYVLQLIVDDGQGEASLPATMVIEATNQAPTAVATADPTSVTQGGTVSLDGSGSSDPEGDPLSYAWSVASAPAGSSAAIQTPDGVTASFVPDLAGDYVIQLVVSDGYATSAPATVTVTAGALDPTPVLDPIGPRTVALGQTLTIQLNATDPNGLPIVYGVGPQPLPAGAMLDAQTGLFTYTPTTLAEVGGLSLIFSAGNGAQLTSETVTVTVTGPPDQTGPTTLSGRLLDADSLALGLEVPVVGATVSLVGQTGTAVSDANGNFTLVSTAGGDQVLRVDGGTATAAPDGNGYLEQDYPYSLIAGVDNQPGEAFPLGRLDAANHCQTVVAGQATQIDRTDLNVSLTVPADAAQDGSGQPYAGDLCLGSLDPLQAQLLLPPQISPCQLLTVQAMDAAFIPGASLSFANHDNLAPGSLVDLYHLAGGANAGAGWRIVADGTVSADGQTVTTNTPGLPAAGYLFIAPKPPSVTLAPWQNEDNYVPTPAATGNVVTGFSTPAYVSLGQPRNLGFVYNSATAAPLPQVAVDTTIAAAGNIPNLIAGTLSVGGIQVAGPIHTTPQTQADGSPGALSESQDETIRQILAFDARSFATGRYPARFESRFQYACSTIGGTVETQVLINNKSDSPFGKGWSIAGLQRLHIQDDGTVVLDEGTGVLKAFEGGGEQPEVEGAILALDEPPFSVEVNTLENDTHIVVFNEATRREVTSPIRMNGIIPRFYDNVAENQAVFLQPGTVVDSYFVHFDLVGINQNVSKSGTITMPRDIIGVITRRIHLDPSDAPLGSPTTIYPDPNGTVPGFNNNARGLELSFNTDRFRLTGDLRQIILTHQTDVSADQMRIIVAPKAPLLSASGFETGDEGWTILGPSEAVQHFPTGGSPGGHIGVTSDAAGQWFWAAPQSVLDAAAQAYGGRLAYDLKISADPVQSTQRNIRLTGAGLNLTYNVIYRPIKTEWRRANVLLHENAGWVLEGTNTAPTQAQFQSVLSALSGLEIRAEFREDLMTAYLDDVRIHGAPYPGTYASPPGDFSELVRNDDGSFTRYLKTGERIEFDDSGRMTAFVDANGNTTTYSYDAAGNLMGVSDPADPNRQIALAYAAGALASVVDPTGRLTTITTSADRVVTAVQMPDQTNVNFVYDSEGRLVRQTDQNGNQADLQYDTHGQMTGTDLPDGASVALEIASSLGLAELGFGTPGQPLGYLAPEDRESRVTDGNGNLTIVNLNEYGAPIQILDPLGRLTTITRNADNLATRIEKPSDGELPDGSVPGVLVTELDYDDRGNVIAKREAVGTTVLRQMFWEYQPTFNRLTKMTDAAGNATLWEYDAKGNPVKITDTAGGVRTAIYEPTYGLMTSETDELGNVTAYSYNTYGNVLTRTDADGTVSRFLRDGEGRVTQVIRAEGTGDEATVSYAYDALNRVTRITDPLGGQMNYAYDANGNLAGFADEDGVSITATYDGLNRLATLADPAYGNIAWAYDLNGNPVSYTDGLNRISAYAYDTVNRLTTITDPAGQVQSLAYDAMDNVTSLTNANGKVTVFAHDLFDRVIRRTNPALETFAYSYDSRDNLTGLIDPKGQVFAYAYDALSRLTQVTKPDGTVNYVYDAFDNLTAANDNSSDLAFTYDVIHRLATAATGPAGLQPQHVLSHSYDRRDNRAGLAGGALGTWAFAHDLNDRMTGLTPPTGGPLTLTYRPGGQMATIAFPNGNAAAFQYGSATSLLTGLDHSAGGSPFVQNALSHDAAGNITGITGLSRSRSYLYDQLNRLAAVTDTEGNESYSYDAEGNRTNSHASVSHSHDDANRLLEDDAYSYVYDANGNLTSKTDKASGDVTTYTWDSLDRLIQITFPDTTTATYAYDAFGRRIEKNVNGVVTRYLYDGWDILAEFDGTGTLLAKYSHGPYVDHPLVMERAGQTYYFHAAQDGSISHVTDSSGAVVNEYIYDAFGNRISVTETVSNPYGFTAREYDPESGLYFYRARYYDPQAGRFISSDPIGFAGGDSNLYAYVFNDPANLVDPKGLSAAGRAGTGAVGATASGGIFSTGNRLACLFDKILSGLDAANAVINDPILDAIVLVNDVANPCRRFSPAGVRKLVCKARKLMRRAGKFLRFGSSFAPDTLVQTDRGPVEIAKLEPGDMVLARDGLTGQESYQPVVDIFFSNHADQLQLKLAKGTDNNVVETLVTTDGHPFYLKDKGWVEASVLKIGDQVMTSGGGWLTVYHSERLDGVAPAFNLEVAVDHTFFVGNEQTWVHNARRFDGPKPKYEPNPAHIKGHPDFDPRKTPEPADVGDVYKNAIPGDSKNPRHWYGKNANGDIYRFSYTDQGWYDRNARKWTRHPVAHFSGIVDRTKVPRYARLRLGC